MCSNSTVFFVVLQCDVSFHNLFYCHQVQGHIKSLIEEHFSSDMQAVMKDPILFGDYRLALSENEPRVYEDIQDYDASKALFQVLCMSCDRCF